MIGKSYYLTLQLWVQYKLSYISLKLKNWIHPFSQIQSQIACVILPVKVILHIIQLLQSVIRYWGLIASYQLTITSHSDYILLTYRYIGIVIGWVLFAVMFYRTFTMELEAVEYDPYEILEISRVCPIVLVM